MLDYSSLFALAAVVKEGSFERAARALHVTPSAVSQRIRLLEERLGCALVIRGQPCEATETGRRLCQHIDRVSLLEHELQADMPWFLQEERTRISVPIAVNADSLATWFMQAAVTFGKGDVALLQIAVDDEGHTAQWLRSGQVLAAVTATEAPAAGCNCLPLGAMRYVAAASPAFLARHFPQGIDTASLALAPSLMFNAKDELQQRWVEQHFGTTVPMPRHTLPSSQAFVAAALGGLGWAMHPHALVREHLNSGALVKLKEDSELHVPLYWQRWSLEAEVLKALGDAVAAAARSGLRPMRTPPSAGVAD